VRLEQVWFGAVVPIIRSTSDLPKSWLWGKEASIVFLNNEPRHNNHVE
jgi:hypothetical protein